MKIKAIDTSNIIIIGILLLFVLKYESVSGIYVLLYIIFSIFYLIIKVLEDNNLFWDIFSLCVFSLVLYMISLSDNMFILKNIGSLILILSHLIKIILTTCKTNFGNTTHQAKPRQKGSKVGTFQ
jgi:hypothetical protein